MSKERLEEIRKDYQKIINLDYEDKFNDIMVLKRLFFENHGKWLIEQAGRAIDYDNKLISIEDNKHYVSELLDQIKRYRDQLKLIRKDTYATEESKKYVSIKHLIRKRVDKALEGEE